MSNLSVSQWMTGGVITAKPYTRLHDARRKMNHEKIRVLPVVDDERLVGIVTWRDLLRNDVSSVVNESWDRYRQAGDQTLENIMTRNVTTISQEAPVAKAARVMLENKISSLPSVTQEQQIIGIITASDIFRFIITHCPDIKKEFLISDYMTRNVKSIDPNTSLLAAHEIMGINRIRALPIIEKGNLVGIATRTDLLMADPSSALSHGDQKTSYRIHHAPIQFIMTKDPIKIYHDEPLVKAAKLMLEYKIHSLPVINENGHLVGIITESDLFRYVVQNFA
jgi:CBS domain-containing protein